MAERIALDLSVEDARTLYELAVARAVALEASEDIAMSSAGSMRFRRPADALARALRTCEAER